MQVLRGTVVKGMAIADYALDAQTHVIEANGPIDLYTAPEFKSRTLDVIAESKAAVIVDLSGARFIDSAGLSVLVTALKRLRNSRRGLALVVTDYDIEHTLEVSGLDRLMSVCRSRDEARAELAAAGKN